MRKFFDIVHDEGGGGDWQPIFGEWQLCPKCVGTGIISPTEYSTSIFEACDVCNGAKIIRKPIINLPSNTSYPPLLNNKIKQP